MTGTNESLKQKLHDAKWDAITARDGTQPPVDKAENTLRARQAHITDQGT